MAIGSSLRANTLGPSAALGFLLGFLHPRALPGISWHLAEEEDVAPTPGPMKHGGCMATCSVARAGVCLRRVWGFFLH